MTQNNKKRGKSVAYETAQMLIDLAMYLQGSKNGRTIDEIRAKLNCSRATAYRWLDSLKQIPGLTPEQRFPIDGDKPNQWRWAIKPKSLPIGASIEAEDVRDLNQAIEGASSKRQRERLSRLKTKIEAISQEQNREKAEVSTENRLIYRGAMIRTGFRYEVDDRWLAEIEKAVARNRTVKLTFREDMEALQAPPWLAHRKGVSKSSVTVRPIGVVAERTSFLIAAGKKVGSKVRAYSFDDISRATETMDTFDSSDLPTLDECARRGLGVRDPKAEFTAIVQFLSVSIEEVQRYRFHPDQEFELYYMPIDPSLSREPYPALSFPAWDEFDLALELLSFGPHVIVISPKKLADLHFAMVSRFYEATDPNEKFDFAKLYRD
jgi:predicted DNA-binding transcriptional regulator YafY